MISDGARTEFKMLLQLMVSIQGKTVKWERLSGKILCSIFGTLLT